jgi:hypothetical protein
MLNLLKGMACLAGMAEVARLKASLTNIRISQNWQLYMTNTQTPGYTMKLRSSSIPPPLNNLTMRLLPATITILPLMLKLMVLHLNN